MKKFDVVMHKSYLVNDLTFAKDISVDGLEVDGIAIPKFFHDKGVMCEYDKNKEMLTFYFQSHDKCQYGTCVEVYFIGEMDNDGEVWNWNYDWNHVKSFWEGGMYFIWKREGSNVC